MNIIKINAGIPNSLSDIIPTSHDQTQKFSDQQGIQSKSGDQMTRLMNLVKLTSENPFHTQVIESIKNQVQSDYYTVDVDTLVSHLCLELSVEGAV